MQRLTKALAWLEGSDLADWVGGPVYPLISALHILAIAFLIAPVILADIRILRLNGMDDITRQLIRVSLLGFGAAATTGALLFTVQATRYVENPAAGAKFALLLLAGANAGLFALVKRTRRLAAALSIALWCLVLLAGRWIAFAT